MKRLLAITFFLLCSISVHAQDLSARATKTNAALISAIQVSSPYARRFFGSTLPATCSTYQTQVDSSTGKLNICTATNTWQAVPYSSASLPASATQGDILYASAANTYSNLAKNTSSTRYLSNTGTSNNPAWAQVALDTGVSGRLPFANLTQGSALSVLGVTGNSTADVASIAAGTDNQVLRRSGTSIAFGAVNLASSNAVAGALPAANGGTGLSALGTGLQQLRVNAGATALEYFTASAGITNSAGANVVPKSDGTNLVASRITDDGTDINIAPANVGIVHIGNATSFDLAEGGAIDLNSFNVEIGDPAGAGNGTELQVRDSNQTISAFVGSESLLINGTTHTVKLNAATSITLASPNLLLQSTTDTTATPTINTPTGIVRIASTGSSIAVTSTLVTTNSLIFATVRSNDTTLKSVQAVAGSGTFTLYGNAAATANCDIQVWIINPAP